jgi:integrase
MSRASRKGGPESWLVNLAVDRLPVDNPHVAAYAAWWRAQGYSQISWTMRVRILARVDLAVGALDTLTLDQIAEFIGTPGWSPQTRAAYYRALHGYFRFKVETGRAVVDPMARMRSPKVPASPPKRPAADDVAQVVLAEAVEPWRTAVMLAYYQGLRCLEIADIRREDVTEATITVRGKGGRIDELPTHQRVWEHLRGRGPGLLVTGPRGDQLTATDVSKRWRNYAWRRGWEVSMHQFRHGYCGRLRRAGVDIRIIQTLMRHTNINTTMRYMHVDEDERRAAIAMI